jgi:hypothetical protein
MFATLPSGHVADVDEIMAVVREFHQASLPREQVPTESMDNGEHED